MTTETSPLILHPDFSKAYLKYWRNKFDNYFPFISFFPLLLSLLTLQTKLFGESSAFDYPESLVVKMNWFSLRIFVHLEILTVKLGCFILAILLYFFHEIVVQLLGQVNNFLQFVIFDFSVDELDFDGS